MSTFFRTESIFLEEIQVKLEQYVHKKTGTKVLHLANDDPENFFCISLRTDPTSSNGVAHILEHIALCGSKKFPVKDPFFKMTRRSMQTFMNALTGQDFTCYPAASLVKKDFYNLFEVYLDAVFYPELKKMSFLQEGWRYEFVDSQLTYKGIVYNEMKGAMQNPMSRLWEEMCHALLPDTIYAFNSGGDPKAIPSLTHTELVAFHKTHYHPSRAIFYFYGNLPIEEHLAFLEDKLLSNVEPALPLPPLAHQPRFSTPRSIASTYPFGEDPQEQTLFAQGVLTTSIDNQKEILALQLLAQLLLDHDASPLKKALLESGLCKGVLSSFETSLQEVPLLIVCTGVSKDNAPFIAPFIEKELQKIAEIGFEQPAIEASLHQLELSRLEIPAQYGLHLFWRSGLFLQKGVDPKFGLSLPQLFDTLHHELQSKDFLKNLLKKYWLNNPHRVNLTLHPSDQLLEEEAKEERERLAKVQLTDLQKEEIKRQAEALKQFQESEEDCECLPKIHLKDLSPFPRTILLEERQLNSSTLFQHATFTNHLTYCSIAFKLPQLNKKELSLLPLLSHLFTQVGCQNRSWNEQTEQLYAHTGGISASHGLYSQIQDPNSCMPVFSIGGKCLDRNLEQFFTLFSQLLNGVDFCNDLKRPWQLLEKYLSELEQSFTAQALHYARRAAEASFSVHTALDQLWSGLNHLEFCREIKKTENPTTFAEQLDALQKKILNRKEPYIILTAEEKTLQQANRFIQQWHFVEPLSPFHSIELPAAKNLFMPIAAPIAFNVCSFSSPADAHPDSAALDVAVGLLRNVVLHPMIREKGGAYGANALHQGLKGVFSLHSYRDPHVKETFETFKLAIQTIVAGKFSQEELEEAQLQVFQYLDRPISPSAKAALATSWRLCGRSDESRQAYRDHLFALTKQEVMDAVATHLLPQQGVHTSLANKELLNLKSF